MLSFIQEVAEESLADKALGFIYAWAPSVIGALLVFIIGRFVAKVMTGLLRKVLNKRNVDATLTGFLCSLTYGLLLTVVIISAIGRLGVNTTSFVAILGAATLALGFALQGTLGNFASGVMLILFRPFKTGDFVETAGGTGIVEEIGIFATKMRTGDNKEIIIPNGAITGSTITNVSAKPTRRVDMVFGIGYGDDIKQAKEVLEGLLAADERILKDPAWTIGVSELADSSVNIVCRPWVNSGDYWGVHFDMHERVKIAFDENGISIPFPQQDVHMHEVGAA